MQVQVFKKGPDYIDPFWLGIASGRPCYNLDPYVQSRSELQSTFSRHAANKSVSLVEGTMGLHDGLAADGADSNAAIARELGLPVLLVVDCRGMHRTVAALLNGLCQFDAKVAFAGVILNRVRTERHAAKLRDAIDCHTDLRVLGCIEDHSNASIVERELGLTPAQEHGASEAQVETIADLLQASCDSVSAD